jgi:hypothetical protein
LGQSRMKRRHFGAIAAETAFVHSAQLAPHDGKYGSEVF